MWSDYYGSKSQSMPALAISGDLSDFDDDNSGSDCENERKCRSTQTHTRSSLSSSSSALSLASSSGSSASVVAVAQRLSWPRRYFQLPVLAVISLGLLPFLQGCLYTIGYRYGRRLVQNYLLQK